MGHTGRVRLAGLVVAALCSGPAWAGGDPEEGARIAGLAGCVACHTAPDGEPLAGGHQLDTRFGTFFGSNLTPDPEHGLGRWTFDDFVRAMRRGRDPKGRFYYPAFPYPSFTNLTDDDLAHLWAWLQAQPPVARPEEPHRLLPRFRGRSLLGLWRMLGFRKGPLRPDPARSDAWNRGAYLVEGAGHCGACHTPRSSVGVPLARRALAGSHEPPEAGPNLTPHPDGLGSWSADDLDTFLAFGMTPSGDIVGGEMFRVVEEGTAPLSADDRAAIVTYLRALTPVPDP